MRGARAPYANECCAGQSAPSAPTPSLRHWIQLYIQFLPMAHSSTAALTVVSAQLDCHTERSEKSASIIIIIIIIVFVSICPSLIVLILCSFNYKTCDTIISVYYVTEYRVAVCALTVYCVFSLHAHYTRPIK